MGISNVARLMAFLLIFQQTRVYSAPLDLPPLRDYPRHKRFLARGFKSHVNHVPFLRWTSNDVGVTVPEFVPEIVRKRLADNENENFSRIEEVKEKRKKHQAARLFRNEFDECLIINYTGKVETSVNKNTCRTYGKFCQVTNGSKFQLFGVGTRKYLAIADNGLIYSTKDDQSRNTKFSYVIENLQNFTLSFYRTNNMKKCYLDVTSNAVIQRCSLQPSLLKPENLGTC